MVHVEANAAVHGIHPMIESLIIDYGREVIVPDEPTASLFSFTDSDTDNGAGTQAREIIAVYSSDEERLHAGDASVPGRYVIVELAPVVNPQPDSSQPWTPESTAGRAVVLSGWTNSFRTDYSGIRVLQKFDARDPDGTLIRPAGTLPTLQRQDVRWPDFAAFRIDQVLHGAGGDVHYSYALPAGYDPGRRYPMVLTVPGYGELLHSLDADTLGVNVFASDSAIVWTRTDEPTIVVAAQPAGYGVQAAAGMIELTEHFLREYAVDPARVYAVGYSAGGEIMSRALNTRADLFAGYVHSSSRWNGTVDDVVRNRTPVYIFMARNDEWYGQQAAQDAYEALAAAYAAEGVSREEIERLVVLDLPDDAYFRAQGIAYVHAGGQIVADKPEVVAWTLSQRRP
jgi:predicted peptidase